MLVDFDQVLVTFEGVPLSDTGKIVTLGRICGNAVAAAPPDDRSTGEQKHKRFKLAETAFRGGDVEMSAEDVAMFKEWIGKAYAPMVVGQAYEMLEGVRIGLSIEAAEKQLEADPTVAE